MVRFTHFMCRHLVALWMMGVASLSLASEASLTVTGLPGVQVTASVLATAPSVTQLPSDSESGWAALQQPLGQGFGQQVYWVRLKVEVPPELLGRSMVLRFHPPNARDVTFYLPDGQQIALGTKAPFDQRMLGFPDLATPFVAEAKTTVLFVRLATAGRMFGTFELMSERSYYQSQAWRTAAHGVLYGMLLLALLVNLVNWATTRQALYGLYVGFVGFSLIASLAVNGYLHAMGLSVWPQQHSTIQLWAFAGMAATAIAFAARLLRLRQWHKQVERVADSLAIILLILGVLAAVWVAWRPFVWEVVLFAFMAYGVGSLVASVRNWYQSRSLHKSLTAIAFSVFATSQWVSMGAVFGVLPATATNLGMWQIGLVAHLVLLQMALLINSRQSRWRDWQQQARLDALKLQADSEARRSRDLQLFLERLTHEFKTPLAVIDSSVQSLEMLEQDPDPQRGLRYDRIRRAVSRLNDLLMRSVVAERADVDNQNRKRQATELAALLEAALGEFSQQEVKCNQNCMLTFADSQIGTQRLRLSWTNIKHPDVIAVEADIGWLQAALYHVFDNALKYSVGDDEISVEIKQTMTDERTPSVQISVVNRCDESLGEADLSSLFEKYFRKGEHGNVSGAGLGLHIARQVIERHGGRLMANLLARGTIEFRIELPLVINEPEST